MSRVGRGKPRLGGEVPRGAPLLPLAEAAVASDRHDEEEDGGGGGTGGSTDRESCVVVA